MKADEGLERRIVGSQSEFSRSGRIARVVALVLSFLLLTGGIAWSATGGFESLGSDDANARSLVYEPPGSISGTVSDSSSNLLEKICVKAYDSSGDYSGYDETNAQGQYMLEGLEPGDYRVKFYDCGDNSVSREFYDNKADLETADQVAVSSGSDTPNIDAQLALGGSISGRVSDSSDDPLEDVCVKAFDSRGINTGFDRTDSTGLYEVGALATGDYRLRFFDCGSNSIFAEFYDDKADLASADVVSVTTGINTPGIDARMVTAGSISGVVTDTSGNPFEDICVEVYDSSGKRAGKGLSGSDGSYKIGGLTTGEYRVSFEDCGNNNVFSEYYEDQPDLASANPVPVTTGVDTPGINAELTQLGSITGRVTDASGDGLQDVCVEAYYSGGDYAGQSNTDQDGNYSVFWLTTGEYRIRFSDCGNNNVLGEYFDDRTSLGTGNPGRRCHRC